MEPENDTLALDGYVSTGLDDALISVVLVV